MKKILIILLLFISVIASAQFMPIYDNARIYGYLIVDDSTDTPYLKVDSIKFGDGTVMTTINGFANDSNFVTVTMDTAKTDFITVKDESIIEFLNRVEFRSQNTPGNKLYLDSTHMRLSNINEASLSSNVSATMNYSGSSSFGYTLYDNTNSYNNVYSANPSYITSNVKTNTNSVNVGHYMYASSGYNTIFSDYPAGYKAAIELRSGAPYYYMLLYNQNRNTTKSNQIYLDTTDVKFQYDGTQYAHFSPNNAILDTIETKEINIGNVEINSSADTLNVTGGLSVGGGDVLTTSDTIDLKTAVESETYDYIKLDTSTQGYSEGKIFYQSSTNSLSFYNDISDFTHNLGYEFCRRVYNGTGSTISNGKAVRRVGTYSNGDIIASVALAGVSSLDSAIVYGIATVDIAPGTVGIVTRGGDVRGLNTSGLNDTIAHLGFGGSIIDTCPEPPYFCVKLGDIIYSDNDSGQVDVEISDPIYYPNPIFSAFFSDSSITITNPGQNVYAKITNATNNAFIENRNIGFTFQGDSVSPNQDGNYTIFYSYSFQGDATQSDLWRIGTFVNNSEIYSTSMTSSSTNNGGVPYPISTYINAGDWISLRVTNTESATRDCTFDDSSIAINFE